MSVPARLILTVVLTGLLSGSPALADAIADRCRAEAAKAQPLLPPEPLEIVAAGGVYPFEIEMVRTDQQRASGLMYRCEVPPGRGMLFDFEGDREVAMWMRNTFVSLDMLFIRADGRIAHIAENTEPLSERIVSSGGPVRAVLEVAAGTARTLGLKPGDRVGHSMFGRR